MIWLCSRGVAGLDFGGERLVDPRGDGTAEWERSLEGMQECMTCRKRTL